MERKSELSKTQVNVKGEQRPHWPRAVSLLSPGCPTDGALFRCDSAAHYTTGLPGQRDASQTAPPCAHTGELYLSLDHLMDKGMSQGPYALMWRQSVCVCVCGGGLKVRKKQKEETIGNRWWVWRRELSVHGGMCDEEKEMCGRRSRLTHWRWVGNSECVCVCVYRSDWLSRCETSTVLIIILHVKFT